MVLGIKSMSQRLKLASDDASLDLFAELLTHTQSALFGRTWFASPWALRYTEPRAWGFHHILQGACFACVDDHPPLTLRAGDLLIVGRPHTLTSKPGLPARPFDPKRDVVAHPTPDAHVGLLCGAYLFASDDAPHPLLTALPSHILLRAAQLPEALPHLIALLASELDEPRPGAGPLRARLMEAVLVYALRAWLRQHDPSRASSPLCALRDPALARALALMHRHPARPWTLAQLARAVGMSRATLARRFHDTVGVAPMHYLTQRRLALARRLLRSSNDTLQTIAAQVGYSSAFALSRAFSRAFGLPPQRFRAQHRATLKTLPAPNTDAR